MEALLRHSAQAYAVTYFGTIIVLALLEWVVPRRAGADTLRVRWAGNIGIYILGTLLLRTIFPMVGVVWATVCLQRGWGVLNQFPVPGPLALVLPLVVLDAGTYVEHLLLHRVPLLWQLHRTHHTDQAFDFTTGVRFHPLEAVCATAISLGLIALMGAPPVAVLVAQLVSVAGSFFEHANVRVPLAWDRTLRWFIVTPDLHRTHHSIDGRESQSNFGSLFPWWDRMFGTYMEQPRAGHEHLAFGVRGFDARKHLTLPWMLAQPFLRSQREP